MSKQFAIGIPIDDTALDRSDGMDEKRHHDKVFHEKTASFDSEFGSWAETGFASDDDELGENGTVARRRKGCSDPAGRCKIPHWGILHRFLGNFEKIKTAINYK